MEEGDIGVVGWKRVGIQPLRLIRKELTATDDLHRLPVGTNEGHQRLRHLSCSPPDGIGLVASRQIVHFQQNQSCITLGDALALAVLLLQSETDARQSLGPSVVTVE